MVVMHSQVKIEWPIKIRTGSVTVKIYFTPTRGNDGFTIAYHEGIRRMRRMFSDLAKARKEAKLISERLNAGQGEALRLTGTDRDSYLYAIGKLRPLDIKLAPAIDEYVEAKKWSVPLAAAARSYQEAHSTKRPTKTVSAIVTELLAAKRTDGASAYYLSDLNVKLNRFSRDFQVNIDGVRTEDIDGWLRDLKMSGRSRNNFRNTIVLLFNFAASCGYLDREKATAAEHTSVARRKRQAIEVFTPAEFSKLLTSVDDQDLPYLVLGGFCGLRTAEIMRLSWDDFKWAESSIVIRAAIAKTGTRRLAPLTGSAVAWLRDAKRSKGQVTTGKLVDRAKIISDTSGVKWKKNALRHSFITYRLAMVKDFIKVAFEAGNSPAVIRSNYDAVATEAEGKLWFSILPETAANIISISAAAA
jgi:integrase